MTNTVYFHNTIRDDVSTTTEEEETPHTSNRYTHHQQGLNPDDDANVDWTPSGEGGKWKYSNSKEFSFIELKTATRNFHKDHVLGDGSHGSFMLGWVDELDKLERARRHLSVFKGWIDELDKLERARRHLSVFKGWIDENKLTATKPGKGIPVAITIFDHWCSFQGHRWQAEVNYLGKLYHPNLLRLLGYCSHNRERLLVYEFMPRGSLDNHLFKKVSTPLSWSVRMKIALGAAKGLAFLHSAPINVIHRDCKSSNILLDTDYNAKLADFGLAIDGPTGDETHVDTTVMGTYGYAAPEYVATGCLTAKCDVYTFGVVLLEMLCGRRVMDNNRPSGEHNLVDWAKPYLKDKHKVYRVADRQLKGQYSLEDFQKAANLALICLSMEGMSRPNMDEVVKVLGEF